MSGGTPIRYAFAGDRKIAVDVLEFIMNQGIKSLALIIPDVEKASHSSELIAMCSHLDDSKIIAYPTLSELYVISSLSELDLDYIFCIHYPFIIPKEILDIPKHGVINLHPAFLPYNKGWHTPTWALINGEPYGATLHFMSEQIDGGDIIHQKKLDISLADTAHILYQKALALELEVFKEAWPSLLNGKYETTPQPATGSVHKKADIASIQEIKMDEQVSARELIKRIRALTTNDINEAAYFVLDGKKYRIQISISEEDEVK